MRLTGNVCECRGGLHGQGTWPRRILSAMNEKISWNGGRVLRSASVRWTLEYSTDIHNSMEDRESFLLTPFERNLAVWRQLWRTLERSHLVVQIVDARNPLGFRCEDLETYVKEVGTEGDGDTVPGPGKRRSLLLVNKADLLTPLQRSVIRSRSQHCLT